MSIRHPRHVDYTSLYLSLWKYNPDPIIVSNSRLNELFCIAVSADTEHLEEIAKFLDYFYSEDGYVVSMWRVEGATFDYIPVEGVDDAVTPSNVPYMGDWASECFVYAYAP